MEPLQNRQDAEAVENHWSKLLNLDQTPVVEATEERSWLSSVVTERPTMVSVFIGLLLIAAVLSYNSVGTAAQMPQQSSADHRSAVVHTEAPVQQTFDADADARAYERDRQQQIEAEEKREQLRTARQAAAEKMERAREDQGYFGQPEWNAVIFKNIETFRALRAAAAASGKQIVECSICNGKSHMDSCFLCNNTGKCHVCEGTGKRSYDETCPSCMGSGHCFLCSGSGKMLCPFCDDGFITAHHHDPSLVIPTH